jgi:hypothetical protein
MLYFARPWGFNKQPGGQTMWKIIMAILVAAGLLGSVVYGWIYVDDRHAHTKTLNSLKSVTIHNLKLAKEEVAQTMQQIQTTVKKTNQRIDVHTINDRIDGITQQMWNIENRCNTTDVINMPAADRERYRRLGAERTRLEKQLQTMNK